MVITRVPKGETRTGDDVEMIDILLRDIKGNRDGEKGTVCQTESIDDTTIVLILQVHGLHS